MKTILLNIPLTVYVITLLLIIFISLFLSTLTFIGLGNFNTMTVILLPFAMMVGIAYNFKSKSMRN
ncbi:hypothetical protein [Geomicrobium sp. JCM 19038]|uniref:hypothetical protein n=1 Tax=Geomicrobium sp. JCM 19038 TaxID=1460635 RepID=UPI00045F1849|nr:hypothetical protein [Geomicrobium sp. JCM 19038]GAK07946.1 hypothetical protein JCM19038_1703 [Geomicrobium sp. JCM 19038]